MLNITGAAGSVIPTGLIASADGTFNSVIRFYETKMAKQPHLFGNGLRLAGTIPRMALKNTSSAPIIATPKFIPLGGVDAGEPVTLPALALAPQQTAEVDLGPLMDAAHRRDDLDTVSVKVTNNGAPGSLIGALYSSDKTTGVNYDVPLRDSGPVRNMSGVYPWKTSDDFTTIIYITNISDGSAEFVAQIHYDGGKYVLGVRKLAAGETAVFDMKKVIDEQKPDYGKRLLPKNLQLGQFKWLVHGVTGGKIILNGRAEMVSRSQRISTSYSCAPPCTVAVWGGVDPGSMEMAVGETYTLSAWEMSQDANGFINGPYGAGGNWSSNNTGVATVDSMGAVTSLAPGQAFIHINTPFEVFSFDGLNCVDIGPSAWEADCQVQAKNVVTLGTVNFSNPNPPVVPEGGIVTVTVPVTAASSNAGNTSCSVCIEPTEASATLVPEYPDNGGSRCSAAQDVSPSNTLGFTVRLRVKNAGPPLPMTFKANGMVKVTDTTNAMVAGMDTKVTTNTATVQAP
jgi:hypothetical protein